MIIARVFPRRTRATPRDALAFVGDPPAVPPRVDAVYISAAFTWDLPEAERLKRAWSHIAPVAIGGPATGMPGADFKPGVFLELGYTITSRGCPNNCWYCCVWKREGRQVRELPIEEGWIIQDDNLLACSDKHILAVIDMLRRQKKPRQFAGGLEAARFEQWKAEAIASVKPKQVFFAYDLPEDFEPLAVAADLCWKVGFTKESHKVRAYVLCGYPGDTLEQADKRMNAVLGLGVVPMAMRWMPDDARAWDVFQRRWARPAIICDGMKLVRSPLQAAFDAVTR
jgi:hypothetical protein